MPLVEVEDVDSLAVNLKSLLEYESNNDISIDFPSTYRAYTDGLYEVRDKICRERELYSPGEREVFIAFAGLIAVGLSVVVRNINAPQGVDPSWPNLSGFVCNPYRGMGIGRLSMETRMRVVRDSFDGKAWTMVREDNLQSSHLVSSVGFKVVSRHENYNVYTYSE